MDNEVYEATFGAEDFETWFLAGASCDEEFTKEHEQQLFDNCLYLANAEERTLTQSYDELRSAIATWSGEWNERATS